MKKKVLLCINNQLGVEIYKKLKKNKKIEISLISTFKKKSSFLIQNKKKFDYFLSKQSIVYDFIVTVYWPWIIRKEHFHRFKKSINFHPSLLPYGRGWYPHIHAQLYKTPYGVTLHEIDKGVDTGKIWCQKKIKIKPFITSDQIYFKAQKEIKILFLKNYKNIFEGKIKSKKQGKKYVYLKKEWLNKIDQINPNKTFKCIDLLNLIRIRTFNKKPFANIKINQKKYKLLLKIISY
jgi:methionyl-tRNA formyltransferase